MISVLSHRSYYCLLQQVLKRTCHLVENGKHNKQAAAGAEIQEQECFTTARKQHDGHLDYL